ncbi:MAG: sodium:solute symporter family protein [Phycisphaeraceae bacterium]|nr:sodium:solute symporter family protein [Phycisphaeraceae bacterium]
MHSSLLASGWFGMQVADLVVIACYFLVVMLIGWWAMRRIRNQEDYFLGGRRFGKLIQVFASFGQATSADSAVTATTIVSTNGAAGVWVMLVGNLFNLPIIWFWSMWFRRIRLSTLADFFEERFDSRSLAAFYALTQAVFLMFAAGGGMIALSKTVHAIAIKPTSALTAEERAVYDLSQRKLDLEARDYMSLTLQEQGELSDLRELNPQREFSYVNRKLMTVCVALTVLVYAGLGGLEGAFLTDLVQGIFMLILSVLMVPFAAARINQLFGSEGIIGPFQTMHEQLPESFFELLGSVTVPDFTWYWIVAFGLLGMINVAVQANGFVGPASARDDYVARYGFVVGLIIKRYATVFWGLVAMMLLLLYGATAGDPDLVWGRAVRDLVGPVGFGLLGLTVACLFAALMSTMSAHQMCVSALLTRNIYLPLVQHLRRGKPRAMPGPPHVEAHSMNVSTDPELTTNAGLSERHMVWAGRIGGLIYIAGGVGGAMFFDSIFNLMKFMITFNSIVAASFWMGMLWRRANRAAAWCSMIVTFVFTLMLPFGLPMVPGVHQSEYLLQRVDQPPVVRTYHARAADIAEREAAIVLWDQQQAAGQAEGERPEFLVQGQSFEKSFKFPARSIFWSEGIVERNGERYGKGYLKVGLVALDLAGWDLTRNSYAFNETLALVLSAAIPFGAFFLVALLTRPHDQRRLDRFYVKMRTKVHADPQIDAHEMELSYADPHRLDHLKLLPRSNWEFRKWDRDDIKGIIGSMVAIAGCLLLLYLMVTLGA